MGKAAAILGLAVGLADLALFVWLTWWQQAALIGLMDALTDVVMRATLGRCWE